MNLSQIQSECSRLLNDPQQTRWSLDVLTTRANLAQTEIQGFTNAVKTVASYTPVGANDRRVNLSTSTGIIMDIIRAERIRSDGSAVPFPGITRDELNFLYPDWQQWPAGEPRYWIFEETSNRLFLVPAPDASNVIADGIQLWQSQQPADMVLSTSSPFDSISTMIPYHMSIVHWVVAQCWMDDGTPEALGKAKFHKSGSMMHPGQYEEQLGRITSEFDAPEIIPSHILIQKQGARIGSAGIPTKSNPLPWG